MRSNYAGSKRRTVYAKVCFWLLASHTFDTELVSKIVFDMHRGKAPDIVGLTVEHIHYSHPSVILLLAKLFQLA